MRQKFLRHQINYHAYELTYKIHQSILITQYAKCIFFATNTNKIKWSYVQKQPKSVKPLPIITINIGIETDQSRYTTQLDP